MSPCMSMPASKQKPLLLPLYPTKRDLGTGAVRRLQSALVPNLLEGGFTDCSEYQEVHVELLRADFVMALVEQLNEYRSSRERTDKIYAVRIKRVNVHTDGFPFSENANRVHFDEKHVKNIKWATEKRLMFGSLVLLSKTDFLTFELAVVRKRPPRLQIEIVKSIEPSGYIKTHNSSRFKGPCLMMETEAFFFPYFHVIERLRKMKAVPFKEEVVHCDQSINTMPQYLKSLFRRPADVDLKLNQFLTAAQVSLSPSQTDALKNVLSHRVALVQGPPGTGKTHLAVKVAQLLLHLQQCSQKKNVKSPIVIITTTRHAVKEYLKRCLIFTDQVLHARGIVQDDEDDEAESDLAEDVDTELQRMYMSAGTHNMRLKLMAKADIIAMTTTRAAFTRSSVLEKLKIQVVLVEEAAEALEAFVIASIPQNCQHLILIGDHKQLRPGTACHLLASRFKLNISLLERLVANGFPCSVLSEQRRMRPEIASLVKHIYPTLTNHSSTHGRPDIAGMRRNVFFMAHKNKEDVRDDSCKSFANRYEARIVVALMRYLLHWGHPEERITILTTYKKQEQLIRAMMGDARGVRLSCVDGFQGEENHIIILSLVRGNSDGTVGFMKLENRACVALSRARDGLFIVGNEETLLASGAPVWKRVSDLLRRQCCLGPAMELQCPHGLTVMAVSAKQIAAAAEGCILCRLSRVASEASRSSAVASAKYLNMCKKCGYEDVRSSELATLSALHLSTMDRANRTQERLAFAVNQVCEGNLDLNDSEETVELIFKMEGLTL